MREDAYKAHLCCCCCCYQQLEHGPLLQWSHKSTDGIACRIEVYAKFRCCSCCYCCSL